MFCRVVSKHSRYILSSSWNQNMLDSNSGLHLGRNPKQEEEKQLVLMIESIVGETYLVLWINTECWKGNTGDARNIGKSLIGEGKAKPFYLIFLFRVLVLYLYLNNFTSTIWLSLCFYFRMLLCLSLWSRRSLNLFFIYNIWSSFLQVLLALICCTDSVTHAVEYNASVLICVSSKRTFHGMHLKSPEHSSYLSFIVQLFTQVYKLLVGMIFVWDSLFFGKVFLSRS